MFHSTLVTPCLSLLALFSIHVTVHSQPGQINCPSSNHPCASVAIGSMCDCNCDCSGTNSICDNSNPNDKKCAVGSGAVGSSSGSCNGEHAGCTDDQNCCSALICNSGKKCAVQSSSTINKCTGYNCADSSALKSGANDIDRGSNPQGNCCFDPKCSNNPGNSPIDYDCSQHGNKQLRSDAQNIQRFGGSGEQTNCCEATGTTSGGQNPANNNNNNPKCTGYNCADSSALKSGANDIDRGSNPQGNCCFDPKCSNNPGNSPIDYDCSQHGNKQLRSDAQNIQRFGGSGEQTNCCEATGTPSGGQNPAPNHAQGTPEGQQQHCQDNKDHNNTALTAGPKFSCQDNKDHSNDPTYININEEDCKTFKFDVGDRVNKYSSSLTESTEVLVGLDLRGYCLSINATTLQFNEIDDTTKLRVLESICRSTCHCGWNDASMKCEFNMIGGEQTCESKNDTDANYKSVNAATTMKLLKHHVLYQILLTCQNHIVFVTNTNLPH